MDPVLDFLDGTLSMDHSVRSALAQSKSDEQTGTSGLSGKKNEDRDTARLPKPRQEQSRYRVRIQTTDLPINKFAPQPLPHLETFLTKNLLYLFTSEAAALVPPVVARKAENSEKAVREWLEGEAVEENKYAKTKQDTGNFSWISQKLEVYKRAVTDIVPRVGARWPKWLEREFADRKARGSNPTSATRLPLSKPGRPGSILAPVLPPGVMAAGHQKGVTAEQLLIILYHEL
ncbi:hypothetical protein T265_05044 [Opisthorchis viverrini]|uniref:Uncharacterized protein n=1 Tax=Opisthorchis viverrini TaxID=6198 RepID=A0A074ZL38_OPIVI|nr:hypothetical protein T265_05044 [Opisthorchis viverrini]KER28068.1 hypothetical protein T265_05044 [Opisthorchis viverrini]